MTDYALVRLDHVNLRTGQLEVMAAFYEHVLGMTPGRRPAFSFPGVWLYVGARAVVHLVGVETTPGAHGQDLRLEHFALSARGLDAFMARLRDEGATFRMGRVPGFGVVQVNIEDPDGNHIHIDFPEDETA